MRKIWLTSAAVAALLAGPTIGFAQSPSDARQAPAASSQQTMPKGNVNEEKDKNKAPKAGQAGERRDTSGSSQAAPMNEKASKSGVSGGSRADDGKAAGSDRPERKGAQTAPGMTNEGKPKAAEKSGASEMKKEQGAQTQPSGQKAQPKASSSTPTNERTTGQSPSDQPMMKGDRANRSSPPAAQQGQTRTDQNRTGQSAAPAPAGTAGQSSQAGRDQGSTGASAAVTPEVQTKFNEVIEKQKVRSTTNVNFSVSVGSTIPRSVHVYDVPRDIVTIYPESRGKKFVVVREEIVIIEPRTHKIVSVIPRSGRTTTGTTSVRQTTSSKLQLAPEQRRIIRETVIKEQAAPRCEELRVSVGAEVPRTIRFNPLPEVVVREVPAVRSYEFCIKDNDVVLIDPREYRVVEVIE